MPGVFRALAVGGLALTLALALTLFVRPDYSWAPWNPAAAPFWAIGGATLAAAWRPKGAL
jgi:hypothetical protein